MSTCKYDCDLTVSPEYIAMTEHLQALGMDINEAPPELLDEAIEVARKSNVFPW